MTDAEARIAARAELVGYVQPGVSPTLTDTGDGNDIDTLLDRHKRASTWAAETAYSVGDVVLPTVRNAHRYLCVEAGTSGETEPEEWPRSTGSSVFDGDGELRWVEDGTDYANIYDVRAAAYEGWIIKSSKAISSFDVTLGSTKFMRSQTYEHCVQMARSFSPMSFS